MSDYNNRANKDDYTKEIFHANPDFTDAAGYIVNQTSDEMYRIRMTGLSHPVDVIGLRSGGILLQYDESYRGKGPQISSGKFKIARSVWDNSRVWDGGNGFWVMPPNSHETSHLILQESSSNIYVPFFSSTEWGYSLIAVEMEKQHLLEYERNLRKQHFCKDLDIAKDGVLTLPKMLSISQCWKLPRHMPDRAADFDSRHWPAGSQLSTSSPIRRDSDGQFSVWMKFTTRRGVQEIGFVAETLESVENFYYQNIQGVIGREITSELEAYVNRPVTDRWGVVRYPPISDLRVNPDLQKIIIVKTSNNLYLSLILEDTYVDLQDVKEGGLILTYTSPYEAGRINYQGLLGGKGRFELLAHPGFGKAKRVYVDPFDRTLRIEDAPEGKGDLIFQFQYPENKKDWVSRKDLRDIPKEREDVGTLLPFDPARFLSLAWINELPSNAPVKWVVAIKGEDAEKYFLELNAILDEHEYNVALGNELIAFVREFELRPADIQAENEHAIDEIEIMYELVKLAQTLRGKSLDDADVLLSEILAGIVSDDIVITVHGHSLTFEVNGVMHPHSLPEFDNALPRDVSVVKAWVEKLLDSAKTPEDVEQWILEEMIPNTYNLNDEQEAELARRTLRSMQSEDADWLDEQSGKMRLFPSVTERPDETARNKIAKDVAIFLCLKKAARNMRGLTEYGHEEINLDLYAHVEKFHSEPLHPTPLVYGKTLSFTAAYQPFDVELPVFWNANAVDPEMMMLIMEVAKQDADFAAPERLEQIWLPEIFSFNETQRQALGVVGSGGHLQRMALENSLAMTDLMALGLLNISPEEEAAFNAMLVDESYSDEEKLAAIPLGYLSAYQQDVLVAEQGMATNSSTPESGSAGTMRDIDWRKTAALGFGMLGNMRDTGPGRRVGGWVSDAGSQLKSRAGTLLSGRASRTRQRFAPLEGFLRGIGKTSTQTRPKKQFRSEVQSVAGAPQKLQWADGSRHHPYGIAAPNTKEVIARTQNVRSRWFEGERLPVLGSSGTAGNSRGASNPSNPNPIASPTEPRSKRKERTAEHRRQKSKEYEEARATKKKKEDEFNTANASCAKPESAAGAIFDALMNTASAGLFYDPTAKTYSIANIGGNAALLYVDAKKIRHPDQAHVYAIEGTVANTAITFAAVGPTGEMLKDCIGNPTFENCPDALGNAVVTVGAALQLRDSTTDMFPNGPRMICGSGWNSHAQQAKSWAADVTLAGYSSLLVAELSGLSRKKADEKEKEKSRNRRSTVTVTGEIEDGDVDLEKWAKDVVEIGQYASEAGNYAVLVKLDTGKEYSMVLEVEGKKNSMRLKSIHHVSGLKEAGKNSQTSGNPFVDFFPGVQDTKVLDLSHIHENKVTLIAGNKEEVTWNGKLVRLGTAASPRYEIWCEQEAGGGFVIALDGSKSNPRHLEELYANTYPGTPGHHPKSEYQIFKIIGHGRGSAAASIGRWQEMPQWANLRLPENSKAYWTDDRAFIVKKENDNVSKVFFRHEFWAEKVYFPDDGGDRGTPGACGVRREDPTSNDAAEWLLELGVGKYDSSRYQAMKDRKSQWYWINRCIDE